MPPTTCPACEAECSDDATACPSCKADLHTVDEGSATAAVPSIEAARALFDAGENEAALALFEQLGAQSEEDAEARSDALAGAAQVQLRLGQYEQARKLCEQILAASGSDLHCARANWLLALAAKGQGRREEIAGGFAEAIAKARSAGVSGRDLLAQVLCYEANRLRAVGDTDAAMDCLHEVRRIVGEDQGANRHLAAADVVEGYLARRAGEFHRAIVLFARAQAAAEEVDDKLQCTLAAMGLGSLRHALGDLTRARRWLEQAHALSKMLGDVELTVLASNQLASVAWAQGDLKTARDSYEDALASYEEAGNMSRVAFVRANLAKLALHEEKWPEALAGARMTLDLLEGGVNENLRASVCAVLGDAQFRAGETQEAASTYELLLKEFTEEEHPHAIARARRGLGRLALAATEFARSCELLRDAVDLMTRVKDEEGSARTRVDLVRALAGASMLREARFELERAREQFQLLESQGGLDALAELEQTLAGQ